MRDFIIIFKLGEERTLNGPKTPLSINSLSVDPLNKYKNIDEFMEAYKYVFATMLRILKEESEKQ